MTWNTGLQKSQEYWRRVTGRAARIPRGPDSPIAGDKRWPNGGIIIRLAELRRRARL